MDDIFTFIYDTHYSFVLFDGEVLNGYVVVTYDNGIDIKNKNGIFKIPQHSVKYFYEINETL